MTKVSFNQMKKMNIPRDAPTLVVVNRDGELIRKKSTFGDLLRVGERVPAQANKKVFEHGRNDGEETNTKLYTDIFFISLHHDMIVYLVSSYDIKTETQKYVVPTAKNGRYYKEVYSGNYF